MRITITGCNIGTLEIRQRICRYERRSRWRRLADWLGSSPHERALAVLILSLPVVLLALFILRVTVAAH